MDQVAIALAALKQLPELVRRGAVPAEGQGAQDALLYASMACGLLKELVLYKQRSLRIWNIHPLPVAGLIIVQEVMPLVIFQ